MSDQIANTHDTAKAAQPIYPPNPFNADTDWGIPDGEYEAVCVDTHVAKNFERPGWKDRGTETVDLVTFGFEIAAGEHAGRRIATGFMTVSLYEKSHLFAFLSAWLARAPEKEFVEESFVNMPARITVTSRPGRTRARFPNIASVAPSRSGEPAV
ncbi:MAG: hypothetical protein WCK89_11100 [bacterium]